MTLKRIFIYFLIAFFLVKCSSKKNPVSQVGEQNNAKNSSFTPVETPIDTPTEVISSSTEFDSTYFQITMLTDSVYFTYNNQMVPATLKQIDKFLEKPIPPIDKTKVILSNVQDTPYERINMMIDILNKHAITRFKMITK